MIMREVTVEDLGLLGEDLCYLPMYAWVSPRDFILVGDGHGGWVIIIMVGCGQVPVLPGTFTGDGALCYSHHVICHMISFTTFGFDLVSLSWCCCAGGPLYESAVVKSGSPAARSTIEDSGAQGRRG